MVEITLINVLEKIKTAEKESLLHTLVEKIAYHLHKENPKNTQDINWYNAQKQLELYLNEFWVFPEGLTKTLEVLIDKGNKAYVRQKGKKSPDIHYEFAQRIVNKNKQYKMVA